MSCLPAPRQHLRRSAEECLDPYSTSAPGSGHVAGSSEYTGAVGGDWLQARLRKQLARIGRDRLILVEGSSHFEFGERHAPDLSATLYVIDQHFYWHLLTGGSLGAAEAYLRGYWRTDNLTTMMQILARQRDSLSAIDTNPLAWLRKPWQWFVNWNRRNSRVGSRRNIAAHYDLSNDFFTLFLDPTMAYSSGIFPSATSTMEEASLAKFDRICRKLKLSPADHLLEIGTGWGGFAIYATREYGCRVTTTTISQEQRQLAQRRVAEAGLEDRITILASDYRDLQGSFDKLVSIEMIEAVGHLYLSTYFEHCCRLLKPAGLFVLQAIIMPDQRYEAYRRGVDFIQRYIFPGGCLPSLGAIHHAVARNSDFQLVHQEDFAAHYARTLSHWHDKFQLHEATIRKLGMDDRFLRAWEYYFAYCQAAFAERQVGVSQLVFARSKARPDLLWEVPPVSACHE